MRRGSSERIEQAPDRGRKTKPAVVLGEIEGFDPHAVAGEKKGPRSRVPYGKGKHPAESREKPLGPPLFVPVEDRLRIRARPEPMTEGLELPPKVVVVVDFSVVRDVNRAVFVRHRLVAVGEIDDAQAARGEPDAVLHEETVVVGAPSYANGIARRPEDCSGSIGDGFVKLRMPAIPHMRLFSPGAASKETRCVRLKLGVSWYNCTSVKPNTPQRPHDKLHTPSGCARPRVSLWRHMRRSTRGPPCGRSAKYGN